MSYEDFKNKWADCQKRIMEHKSFSKWRIAKFKSMETEDGGAFSCVLLFSGKKVGIAGNDGSGGPDYIQLDKALDSEAKTSWEEMLAIAKELCKFEGESLVLDTLLKRYGV